MALGNTHRGRHAHQVPKRRAPKRQTTKFKLHAGLASTAVALSAVIAVTAMSAVNSTSASNVDAQSIAAPETTLTGLGTVGQEETQTASTEEVAIMAAAELLTVSHTVSETPEVVLAREELAALVDQFSQSGSPDQESELPEVADLSDRTKAASRSQTRSAPDQGTETAPPEDSTSDLSGADTAQTPPATTDPEDSDSAPAEPSSDTTKASPKESEGQDAGALSSKELQLAELDAAAEPEQDPSAEEGAAAVVTLADIEHATLALESLLEPEQLVSVASAQDVKDEELVEAWQQAVTLTASTSGYSNGRIPLTAMSELTFAPGHYVRADGAMMLELLNAEFRSVFGHDIAMTDSYRSYSLQVITKANKGYLAATPGRSNHGLGLALDLRGDVATWGTIERNWLVEHGADYGWISPAWAQPGVGKEEPWHWEFAGSSVSNVVIPKSSQNLTD